MTVEHQKGFIHRWLGELKPVGIMPPGSRPFVIIPEEGGPEFRNGAEVLNAQVECLDGKQMVDFTFAVSSGVLGEAGLCEVTATIPTKIVGPLLAEEDPNASYIEYLKSKDLTPEETVDPLRHIMEPLALELGFDIHDPRFEYFNGGFGDPLAMRIETSIHGLRLRVGGSTQGKLSRAWASYLKLMNEGKLSEPTESEMQGFLTLALRGMVETLQTEMTNLEKFCEELADERLGVDREYTDADLPELVSKTEAEGGLGDFFTKRTIHLTPDQAEQFFLDKPVDIMANALGGLEKTETRDGHSMRVAGVQEDEDENRVHAWGRAVVVLPAIEGGRGALVEGTLFDLRMRGNIVVMRLGMTYGNSLDEVVTDYGDMVNDALAVYLSDKEGIKDLRRALRGLNTTMLQNLRFSFSAKEIREVGDAGISSSPTMELMCLIKGDVTEEAIKQAYLVGARSWGIMSDFLHLFHDVIRDGREDDRDRYHLIT